jgi:CsoR family transcriptional regulator, copper-sensing transcriptional repressor
MSDREAVIKRLRRIEGQIKGIQKMVEEEKFCGDILIQVAAARSALNSAGGLILENYIKVCIESYIDNNKNNDDLDGLVDIMVKYTKQN